MRRPVRRQEERHGAAARVAAEEGFAVEIGGEIGLFAGGLADVDENAVGECSIPDGGPGFGGRLREGRGGQPVAAESDAERPAGHSGDGELFPSGGAVNDLAPAAARLLVGQHSPCVRGIGLAERSEDGVRRRNLFQRQGEAEEGKGVAAAPGRFIEGRVPVESIRAKTEAAHTLPMGMSSGVVGRIRTEAPRRSEDWTHHEDGVAHLAVLRKFSGHSGRGEDAQPGARVAGGEVPSGQGQVAGIMAGRCFGQRVDLAAEEWFENWTDSFRLSGADAAPYGEALRIDHCRQILAEDATQFRGPSGGWAAQTGGLCGVDAGNGNALRVCGEDRRAGLGEIGRDSRWNDDGVRRLDQDPPPYAVAGAVLAVGLAFRGKSVRTAGREIEREHARRIRLLGGVLRGGGGEQAFAAGDADPHSDCDCCILVRDGA